MDAIINTVFFNLAAGDRFVFVDPADGETGHTYMALETGGLCPGAYVDLDAGELHRCETNPDVRVIK